jgi:hypothetical protein
MSALLALATRFEVEVGEGKREQLFGAFGVKPGLLSVERTSKEEDRWAIRLYGNCLHRGGEWEYEPQPSSRAPEFLASTRFTLREALVEIGREDLIEHVKQGSRACDVNSDELRKLAMAEHMCICGCSSVLHFGGTGRCGMCKCRAFHVSPDVKVPRHAVLSLLDRVEAVEAALQRQVLFHRCADDNVRSYPGVVCSTCRTSEKDFGPAEEICRLARELDRARGELAVLNMALDLEEIVKRLDDRKALLAERDRALADLAELTAHQGRPEATRPGWRWDEEGSQVYERAWTYGHRPWLIWVMPAADGDWEWGVWRYTGVSDLIDVNEGGTAKTCDLAMRAAEAAFAESDEKSRFDEGS